MPEPANNVIENGATNNPLYLVSRVHNNMVPLWGVRVAKCSIYHVLVQAY